LAAYEWYGSRGIEVLLGKDGCAKTVHCVPTVNERRNEMLILDMANLCFRNVLMVKRPLSSRFSNKSISRSRDDGKEKAGIAPGLL
jgi:hypothetical protein